MIEMIGDDFMPIIKPISDLRNNFAEISRIVHETGEPIFLTKNGYGDMVVMSIETYEAKQFENEIVQKLKEAQLEAKSTDIRYSHEEVISGLKLKVAEKSDTDYV